MRSHKHALLLIGLLAVLLLATACGSTTVAPKPTPTPTAAASTPTGTPPKPTPTPTHAAPTPTPTAAVTITVTTGTVTLKGKATTVLTNVQGFTLYYFKPDTVTTSKCTGACAQTWMPLLLPTGTPTSATTLPGQLTVVNDANGRQVQYNGHFLYTFRGDTAPGQANGADIGTIWFVATPTIPVLT